MSDRYITHEIKYFKGIMLRDDYSFEEIILAGIPLICKELPVNNYEMSEAFIKILEYLIDNIVIPDDLKILFKKAIDGLALDMLEQTEELPKNSSELCSEILKRLALELGNLEMNVYDYILNRIMEYNKH